MTVDNTKVKFSSLWDIDQQVYTATYPVSSGANAIYTFSDSAYPPTYEAQYQPSGSTKWFDVGMSSTNNTVAGIFTFYTYTSGTTITVVPSAAGSVRLFVYEDYSNHV